MKFWKKIGYINKKVLSKMIFFDKSKKEMLDSLTKEYVVPKIKSLATEISKSKMALVDAPLLFDMGLDKFCDITIGVISKKETCIDRICKRDGICADFAKSRIASQRSQDYFKVHADYCISNNDGDDIRKQITEIFERKKSV